MAFLLGVDGGGTGTTAVVADLDGTLRGISTGAASNRIVVGDGAAGDALGQTVLNALAMKAYDRGDCAAAVFGLAALGNVEDEASYRALITRIGLGGTLQIESDVVIAWAVGTFCQPGLAVIAGTGSSCFGINAAGERCRALGWDYVLADQGSGYWIGLQGLQRAIAQWDGRYEVSPLLSAMIAHYGLNQAEDMLALAYQPDFSKTKIASFAKAVTQCAGAGDPQAAAILSAAGDELGLAVIGVARQLNMLEGEFVVGLVGGMFNAGALLTDALQARIAPLAPQARLNRAVYIPAIGALMMAAQAQGVFNDDFLARLQASYPAIAEAANLPKGTSF